MRMSGKISVGVHNAASGPMIRMSSASTTNVYGRLRAMRTMPFIRGALLDQSLDSGCGAKITPPASGIARVLSNHLVLIDFAGILRFCNMEQPKSF